jgi:hypothetical protein
VSRKAIPAEAFDHGDPRRYRRGCRCGLCKKGISAATRRQAYLRKTGRGTQRTPDRAANHVTRLREAGLNDLAIRDKASVCPDVLYRIMRREGTIHATTEQRILAVRVPDKDASAVTTSRAYIPAIGTLRRLRALVAAGWYAAELARRLRRDKQYLVYLTRGQGGDKVARFFAEEVDRLYRELSFLKPEEHGVKPYYAERARTQAAAEGWLGPGYWDDDEIDDPDFVPATGHTHRYIRLAEDGLELEAQQGYTRQLAADRLGVSKDALQQAISRYRDQMQAAA